MKTGGIIVIGIVLIIVVAMVIQYFAAAKLADAATQIYLADPIQGGTPQSGGANPDGMGYADDIAFQQFLENFSRSASRTSRINQNNINAKQYGCDGTNIWVYGNSGWQKTGAVCSYTRGTVWSA